MIFHITSKQEWDEQHSSESFTPKDFYREGFVHCCTREQIEGVLTRYFKGQSDLLLLHIDE